MNQTATQIPTGWPARTREEEARLATMVQEHHALIWRVVRRVGIPEADADDVVQEAFLVAAQRLGSIDVGKERSFLYSCAVRVAANARRALRRRQNAYDGYQSAPREEVPLPDGLSDRKRACEILDEILDTMPEDLRQILILYELEGLGVREIGELLDIPVGTVGSRLRRAREKFEAAVARRKSKAAFRAGVAT